MKEISPAMFVPIGRMDALFNVETLYRDLINAMLVGEGDRTFLEFAESRKKGNILKPVEGFVLNGKFSVKSKKDSPKKNMYLLPFLRSYLVDRSIAIWV
ncbi:MAG: hypothetical protein N2513_10460 [Deltaproteobacteria bacterium]|nr:hypothetical protein [Deltaproteobacteria bacterium]